MHLKTNNYSIMFSNIFKISIRNIRKNSSHTIVNVIGLSLGISAAIVIYSILRFDLSFDNYHSDSESIYRLVRSEKVKDSGDITYDTGIPYPLRLSFKEEFPDVEFLTFVDCNSISGLVTVDYQGKKTKYEEPTGVQAFVMQDFFEIFHYEFLSGNPEKALAENYKVVLSKSLAEKYFGDYQNALGQTINIENYFDLTVTGVVADPPMNTDLPLEMLMSFEIGGAARIWDSWTANSSSVNAFVKLNEGVRTKDFGKKIEDYIQKNKNQDDPKEVSLQLQSLSEIHFNDQYMSTMGRVISLNQIYTLAIIGLLMVVAACINFINLNTASSSRRSKEIGVRKVLGSDRFILIAQFMTETAFTTFIAILLSLGLAELFSINIGYILGYNIPSTSYDVNFFISLAVIFVTVTVLSGLYPSVVTSGLKPISALKNSIGASYKNGLSLRSALVVVQLLISQVLIVAVIVVSQQIDHFINQPIGVDTEALVEFSIPYAENMDRASFKQQLLNVPGVENVTLSNTGTTSVNTWGGVAHYAGADGVVDKDVQIKLIDDAYLNTYGLELLAGKNIKNDSIRRYLINEETMATLGFETYDDALGEEIAVWGKSGNIVGVVKDFKTMSLHYAQQPVVLWYADNSFLAGVKLNNNSADWSETMASVQTIWETQFPDNIFSYNFLDGRISQYYEQERRTSKTFSLFASIAVIIGGIGLLGLMSYMVNTRTKEIGVRKVLGASVNQILATVFSDFVKLVIIAFALAVPISWYFMDMWLQGFDSRVNITFLTFIMALMLSLLMTIIATGYKSIKGATLNPVDALADE